MCHLSPNSTIRLMKDVEISGVIALLCAFLRMQCVHILHVCYRLTLMYVAVLRRQGLFPWKQGAGEEMATPPEWEERLVLSLVSQVSPPIAFQNI